MFDGVDKDKLDCAWYATSLCYAHQIIIIYFAPKHISVSSITIATLTVNVGIKVM